MPWSIVRAGLIVVVGSGIGIFAVAIQLPSLPYAFCREMEETRAAEGKASPILYGLIEEEDRKVLYRLWRSLDEVGVGSAQEAGLDEDRKADQRARFAEWLVSEPVNGRDEVSRVELDSLVLEGEMKGW